jgi:hypothetical protein
MVVQPSAALASRVGRLKLGQLQASIHSKSAGSEARRKPLRSLGRRRCHEVSKQLC